jgi:peptide/nickel transport system substrate-binding protein
MTNSYWTRFQKARISRRRVLQAGSVGGAGLATAFLVGCGSGDESAGSGPTSSSPAASTSGTTGSEALAASQELIVRYYDDPGGFDPATLFRIEVENIAFNVYSGLTSYEPDAAGIIPDLADSWEMTDPLTYNFKLAQGVTWHKNFGEFTAEDVVYSYERILDPATSSTYAAEFNNVDSVSAPDASTVVIKLKQADANFLHQVANYHQGQVVNRRAIEQFGEDYKFNPVGTGPFVFESFTPAQEIVLIRHDGYFKGPATLERIEFRIIKEDNTAAIALQNGEVDLAMRISDHEALQRVIDDGSFTMNSREGHAVSLTIFNLLNEHLKDERVRYAFAHAVDYATVYETVAPLTSSPWYNLLPEFMDVFAEDVPRYAYDEKTARAFMEAAGLEEVVLNQPTIRVTEQSQLIQAYLDKIGIRSEFSIVDTPTYNGIRARGEFDVSGRLLPAVNPDTILFSYLHPDNTAPAGLNGARYDNPEVTRLLESARAEPDFETRKDLYAQVQKMALTDLPYLPTSSSKVFYPGKPWVSNVKLNPLAQVHYYDIKLLEH